MLTNRQIEKNINQLEKQISSLLNEIICLKENDKADRQEYMQYLNTIQENTKRVLAVEGEKYTISETKFDDKEFLWVCDTNAMDPITENAKKGVIVMDSEVFDIFHKENGVFLDLGANIGGFSLPMASEGWRGYAFEAGTSNADVLNKSIELNGFDVKVVKKAIYDKTGKIYFVANGPWGFVKNSVFCNEKYEELDAISLNDWYKTENIKAIDLIKIDIEGSEVAALRGMNEMLETFNYPPIYTEVNTFALALQGETQYSYFKEAEKLGYRIYEIYDGKLFEYNKEIFPMNYCRDYVFLKEIPDYIKPRINGRIANNDNARESILQRLKKYNCWSDLEKYGNEKSQYDYDSYLCLNLKDFPNMLDPEIKDLLLKIKREKKDNPIIKKNLEWFD